MLAAIHHIGILYYLFNHSSDNVLTAVVLHCQRNDFHLFRAKLIARREGMQTVGVPAELPWWWLTANYYLREPFALVKTLIFD